jgi:hypothetical protein
MEAGIGMLVQIAIVVCVFTWASVSLVWLLRELWREIVKEWRWCDDVGDRQVESSTFVEDNERGGE